MFSQLQNILQEVTPEAKEIANHYVDDIYSRFRKHVEDSRGSKLKISGEEREKTIYSSDVFHASRALELG